MSFETHRIFDIQTEQDFNELALALFRHQSKENAVYRSYLRAIGRDAFVPGSPEDIPFLPISFFKTMVVQTGDWQPVMQFTSSATTSGKVSRHPVLHPDLYEKSFLEGFSRLYGHPREFALLGLLPSYLERPDASLVYMVDHLMKSSGNEWGGFFLDNQLELHRRLEELKEKGQKTMLIGVTFALLDMSSNHPMHFPGLMVVETGGMKGRGEELTREEVHQRLASGFGVQDIHSEYGMTELFSQAWSRGQGRFQCPPWMKVQTRELRDPLARAGLGVTGGLNIMDLANCDSCAFIATDDLGRVHSDGTFEVLGRFDQSEIRGCNLMVV